jgi:hypothetical protein
MDKKSYKKQILLVLGLIVLIALFSFIAIKVKKYVDRKKEPTLEQKVESMKNLSEYSKKIPEKPIEQKQKSMDDFVRRIQEQQAVAPETSPVSEN